MARKRTRTKASSKSKRTRTKTNGGKKVRTRTKKKTTAPSAPAESKKDWNQHDNYGGPRFYCGMCAHWSVHTTRCFVDDRGNKQDGNVHRKCILKRDEDGTKLKINFDSPSCEYFSMKSSFWCEDTGHSIHWKVCTYRYYNDIERACRKCSLGDRMMDFAFWWDYDVPEQEDIQKSIGYVPKEKKTE